MIRQLTLQNFQAHKTLVLDLDPHVTVIVGPSDVGKSAVVRALRWVVLNEPAGNDFLRHGAVDVQVTLQTGEAVVTRERGKRNLYTLDDQELEAFGTGVPACVTTALRMSELNFQQQHDGPYWFSKTAGEVSRQLNAIVDLGIIDTTLSNLASAVRETQAEERVVSQRVDEAKEQRSVLMKAKDMDASLRQAEQTQQVLASMSKQRGGLEELLTGTLRHQSRSARLHRARLESRRLLACGEAWEGALCRRDDLVRLLQEVKEHTERAACPIPDLAPLQVLNKKQELKREDCVRLESLLADIEHWSNVQWTSNKDHEEREAELAKQIGKVCPLCKQTIRS